MAIPSEHKTVQARILDYVQEAGWTLVSRAEAEARRGFDKSQIKPADQAKADSPFFVATLFERVKALNTGFADWAEELARKLAALPTNIRGNCDFLRTQGNLGNYLMASIPYATFIGFTGTPAACCRGWVKPHRHTGIYCMPGA